MSLELNSLLLFMLMLVLVGRVGGMLGSAIHVWGMSLQRGGRCDWSYSWLQGHDVQL